MMSVLDDIAFALLQAWGLMNDREFLKDLDIGERAFLYSTGNE